jgi:hypothetical protein
MKINFTWDVCTDGYEWKEVGRPSRFGSEKMLEPRGWRFRTYQPLKEFSALFLDFAALETEEDIRRFADRYGNLGVEVEPTVDAQGEPLEPPEDCVTEVDRARYFRAVLRDLRRSDRLGTWEKAIADIRKYIDLWDKVRSRTNGRDAMKELKDAIDVQLEIEELRVAFVQDATTGAFSFQVEPRSLLGALWAQFALAVIDEKSFRRCKTCLRWFELAPELARTNRNYCSEACRSKAYRGRKEWARELSAQGRTPEDIARELESEPETVRSWLTTTKEVHHGTQTKGSRRGRRLPAAERRQVGRLDHHGEDPLGPPEAEGRLRQDQGGGAGETP